MVPVSDYVNVCNGSICNKRRANYQVVVSATCLCVWGTVEQQRRNIHDVIIDYPLTPNPIVNAEHAHQVP